MTPSNLEIHIRAQEGELPLSKTLLLASLVFLGAFVLNQAVGVWALQRAPLLDDAVDYFERGVQLWRGLDDGRAHYWPPGGPFVLRAFFNVFGAADVASTQTFMAVLSALTSTGVFLAALVLTTPRVAGLAVLLYALSPTTLWMARQTESHTFCAFWVALAALCAAIYIRRGYRAAYLLSALGVGALVLTRPGSALLLAPVLALPVVLGAMARQRVERRARRLLKSLMMSLLAVAIVAGMLWPVLQYNHNRGAGWALSTNNERNFFLGNNPYTHPYKTGHMAWRSLGDLPTEEQSYLRAHYASPDPRQAMLQSSWTYIRQEPLAFGVRCINRFVNFWTFDYEQGRRLQIHLAVHGWVSWLPMLLQAAFSFLLIWSLALGLPALFGTGYQPLVLGVVAVCLLYQLPHVLAFSSPVYRAGLAPLISLLAAAGIMAMWRTRQAPVGTPMAVSRVYVLSSTVFLVTINAQAAYYLVKLR